MINPKSDIFDYIINFREKSINKIDMKIDDSEKYKNLIFTRDSSLLCGDSLENYDSMKDRITKEKIKNNSFHCEIVSPIIETIEDIKLLYSNLFRINCFKGNESAAFHVNVSIINQFNEPFNFSKGFLDCFLDLYEKYESKNYDEFRPYGSWYAKRILDYAKSYTFKRIRSILDFENDEKEKYFFENFIEGKKYYRSFIDFEGNRSSKYNSIHSKNGYIMEFRLFPTEDDKDYLISYLTDSIDILRKAAIKYSKDNQSIINKIQKINLEIKINYKPLNYYIGYLYGYDKNKDEYYDCKTNEEVLKGLDTLLDFHYQNKYRKNIVSDNEYSLLIYNNESDIKEKFNLKIKEDGYIILNKVDLL